MGSAAYQEKVRHGFRHHYLLEFFHEFRHQGGVNVAVRGFMQSGKGQLLKVSWVLKLGVIVAHSVAGKKREKVNIFPAGDLVHKIHTMGLFQIE